MSPHATRLLLALAALTGWIAAGPLPQPANAAPPATNRSTPANSTADGSPPNTGTISIRDGRWVQFPEPVVSHSIVENARNDELSATDRGTDLFTISGDTHPLPTAYWQDQDTLRLQFPEGSTCTTEYHLTLKPGTTYLSNKAIEPRTIHFHRPSDTELEARHISGTADSYLISPRPRPAASLEEQNFSVQSPVTYRFRSYKRDSKGNPIYQNGERVYDKEIPATARPSTLADGLSQAALGHLVKKGTDNLRHLKPDSPIPGQIVLTPDQPLDPTEEWTLWSYSQPHTGFPEQAPIRSRDALSPATLTTHVSQDFDENRHQLTITYSQDLHATAIPDIFRKLILRIGEHTATLNPDGTSWQLITPDQTLTLRLAGPTVPPPSVLLYPWQNDAPTYTYQEPDTYRGLNIHISGLKHPAILDITLPENTRAKRGLTQEFATTHRITLNPSAPLLRVSGLPTQLPLTGDHTLRLQTLNQQALRAKAYHWDAGRAAAQYDLIRASLLDDSDYRLATYLKQLLEARDREGMPLTLTEEQKEALETGWDILQREHKKRHRSSAMAGATTFPDTLIPIPGANTAGATGNSELSLNLDTLTGGNTRPGLYLIAVTAQPSAPVLEALTALGLPEDTLNSTTEYLVQVSDLQVTTRETLISLFSGADGAPIRDARARFFTKPAPGWFHSEDSPRRLREKTAPRPLNNGILVCDQLPHLLLIQSGDDYILLHKGRNHAEHHSGEQTLTLTITDRNLYRPGDTVHLHSLTRHQRPDNQLRIPAPSPGTLTVKKPNGDTLLTRPITFDSVGSSDTTFALPEGDEDVTGTYTVLLTSNDETINSHTTIRCEIFRRDSMSGDLQLHLDPIAPQRATLRIQGRDLNGTALAGARVELTLRLPGELTGTSSPLPRQNNSWQRNKPETLTRELTLDSNGCAELTTDLRPLGSHSSGFTVLAEATLINDREEHYTLPPAEQHITPGKLVLALKGSQLTLNTPGGDTWQQAQTVRVRIMGDTSKTTALGNGFSLKQTSTECLRDLTLTVPANTPQGIPLPLQECARQAEQSTLTLLLETQDDTGRHLAQLAHWNQWDSSDSPEPSQAAARSENRHLIIPATFDTAGTALVTLHAGRRIRSLLLPTQAGRHEYRIELQPEESGTIDYCLTRMEPDSRGIHRHPVTIAGNCDVPFTQQSLTLNLPSQTAKPGATVTLSGTVHTNDGQPAANTAVTLYAVDAGMLSLTGCVTPDPLHYFYETTHITFRHSMPLTAESPVHPQPLQPEPLPGLWLGDVISGPVGDHTLWDILNADHPSPASGSRKYTMSKSSNIANTGNECAPAPVVIGSYDGSTDDGQGPESAPENTPAGNVPRLRSNFTPVAIWQGNLRTDAQGRFSATCTLPDTLTTYRVIAIAASNDGQRFGTTESELHVNQPVMLTPGTPHFMSTGDTLHLPLTITNNTQQEDTWTITLQNSSATTGTQATPEIHTTPDSRQIRLSPGETRTLHFTITPKSEGSVTLHWSAQAASGSDAVAGSFNIRYPAPVLRESHHLVLRPGQQPTAIASLPAPKLAGSTRSSVSISLSANPLIHLAGCADFLCNYPYGSTEQTASALLPYLLHRRLAPFTPSMSQLTEKDIQTIITDSITQLLQRQQHDGGLSYWNDSGISSPWASAYAAMVLTLADELGHNVPRLRLNALRAYLRRELKKDAQRPEPERHFRTLTLYAAGRALSDNTLIHTALQQAQADSAHIAACRGRDRALPDLLFISTLRHNPGNRHEALITWQRSRGHDYRHRSSWSSGWTLLALAEYLQQEPGASAPATVRTETGQELTLGNGITTLTPPETQGKPLRELATTLTATRGNVYATVNIRALPETTHFPGVTEKGLQVTRLYEKKGTDGIWRPASEFAVGDIVRITLTCAKIADEIEYLVLEDYLPASMEAINPAIPSQADGLEPLAWSLAFDHREYLAERVRGFCTRWAGRDVVNLRYYARVKRAGTATAPPASAQLMYEPQCYGLSDNQVITTR